MSVEAIRSAWRLFKSDSEIETVGALVIVGIALLPVIQAYYSNTRNQARQ